MAPSSRGASLERAWVRSRICGLDQGAPLDLPYQAEVQDSRFARAARPVLNYLGGLLPGCGTAAVLLHARGRLLVRVCDDISLERRMDAGNSAPGFVWSDEYAGANAVGIALEERIPAWTIGQDHYMEALRDLACAAVPIINPLNQRVEGVLDLTANLTKSSPLMLPIALQASKAIEQRLIDVGTVTEQLLLDRFLAASRRPGKMVLVLSERTELSTKSASRLLSHSDKALLTHAAGEQESETATRVISLSNGTSVQAHFERIDAYGRAVGSVVTIENLEIQRNKLKRSSTARARESSAMAADFLGRSAASEAIRNNALSMAAATFPLLIAGEAGVGKVHLAKVLGRNHRRVILLGAKSYSSNGDTAILREVSALSKQRNICVVLPNLNSLPAEALQEISSLARLAEENESRFISTVTSTGDLSEDVHVPIGVRIHVPPLRERPEDILDLAPVLLDRRGSKARISTPVMQALMRYPWPGNISELDMVLAAMLNHQRGFELTLADLPPHYQRGVRRLRRIEHVERTAIMPALAEADGNKTRAAEILEIGRATLYRKIRVYGLDPHSVAL